MRAGEEEDAILYAVVPDFYAEIERRDAPELADRPILVGGDPAKRGKVQSASAEARSHGVRVGDPMVEALARCPGAVHLPTDMKRYREVQSELLACLREATPALEPDGFGAIFVDGRQVDDAIEHHAEQLVRAVEGALRLALGVGIGPSKLVARLAAGVEPGPGVHRVHPDEVVDFLAPLPLAALPRVGQKAQARLADLGATTIGAVVELGADVLERELGARGLAILELARGADRSRVRAARAPKSISREETLGAGEPAAEGISDCLRRLAGLLERSLLRHGLRAGRIALKVRLDDQTATTRSTTLGEPVVEAADIYAGAIELLGRARVAPPQVRGVGVTVAGLVAAGGADRQLELFPGPSSS